MPFTDYTPYSIDGEYWFSHAYYPDCRDCNITAGEVELKTIDETHNWCQEHSAKHGCKFIRVEHVIHWEMEEE